MGFEKYFLKIQNGKGSKPLKYIKKTQVGSNYKNDSNYH